MVFLSQWVKKALIVEPDPPKIVNVGFIGWYWNNGNLIQTSIHFQEVELDTLADQIDWEAVWAAYDGNNSYNAPFFSIDGYDVVVDAVEGWETSGPFSMYYDGAEPGPTLFTEGMFEQYQLQQGNVVIYMMPLVPGIPEEEVIEEEEEEVIEEEEEVIEEEEEEIEEEEEVIEEEEEEIEEVEVIDEEGEEEEEEEIEVIPPFERYTYYVYVWNNLYYDPAWSWGQGLLEAFGGSAHQAALWEAYGPVSQQPYCYFGIEYQDDYDFWANDLEIGLMILLGYVPVVPVDWTGIPDSFFEF